MGCTHSACACFWSIWFLLLHVGLSFSGIFKISYNIPSFLYIFRLPSMFCLRNISLGMFKNFPWSVTLLWGEVMEDMGRALSTRKGSRGQSTLLCFLVLCLWQVAWLPLRDSVSPWIKERTYISAFCGDWIYQHDIGETLAFGESLTFST